VEGLSSPVVVPVVTPAGLAAGPIGPPPLPVAPPLRALFAEGGLRRGSVVAVARGPGATALVLALLAPPLAAGSWAGVVGLRTLGLEAAVGLGVRLDRLAVVPEPGTSWATVTAALLDALDVVVVVPPRRCRPTEVRQLVARARQRGAVLVVAGDEGAEAPAWSERPDVELATEVIGWEGLGAGSGTLRRRLVVVSSAGRRGADRRSEARVWLPDSEGRLLAGAATPRGSDENGDQQLRPRVPGTLARAG
jgi:hypothetical protein